MRRRPVVRGRWIVSLLALLAGFGLASAVVGRLEAVEPVAWEALGPDERAMDRLFTPTSGALLAQSKAERLRSGDAGLTWVAVPRPSEAEILTVSPANHDLLYAAGKGGVFRSEDGGLGWQLVSDRSEAWVNIEVDPADPATPYGVTITSPPADRGSNRWHEFLVSHDGGETWSDLPDSASVNALAVGVDGRYLFAATSSGVNRIELSRYGVLNPT